MFKFSLISFVLVTSAFLLVPIAQHQIEAPPPLIFLGKKKAGKFVLASKPAVSGKASSGIKIGTRGKPWVAGQAPAKAKTASQAVARFFGR